MASNKPRIQALLEPDIYKSFKKLCNIDGRSESNLAGKIITEYIIKYEKEHGKIETKI